MMKNPEKLKSLYFQQVESLSPENRLSKFCKEAGFMRVVEVGQYFVTRNVGEFQQTVACREYTFHETTKLLNQKGGSEEICVKGMYPAPHIHEHLATAY